VIDVPVGFAGVEEATEILRAAAGRLAEDPEWGEDLIEAPEVLGVEQITVDGAVLRTTVKTTPEARWRVGREMRRRLTEALETGGIAAKLGAGRVFLHPPMEVNGATAAAGAAAAGGVAPAADAAATAAPEIAPSGTAGKPSTGPTTDRPAARAADRSADRPADRPGRPGKRADDDEQTTDSAVTSAATSPAVAEGLTESSRGGSA
jgi:hypothetical protein